MQVVRMGFIGGVGVLRVRYGFSVGEGGRWR